jgi:hypothetical protein
MQERTISRTVAAESAPAQPNATAEYASRAGQRLFEAFDELFDVLVEPDDVFADADGTRWTSLVGGTSAGTASGVPFSTESQLTAIREQCRALALANEFAINGHENRISYVVGTGYAFRAVAQEDSPAALQTAREVEDVIDEFVERNRWHRRQQEVLRRLDRDGEVFLRLFVLPGGKTAVRFVDPAQVSTPPRLAHAPAASFGIHTDADDVETVHGYYIDGHFVAADEIQHRKANVDGNVKRGLPLFFPVRKNLRRAEKLLRNMSVVAGIQSAIAIIRKHGSGTRASVRQFVQNQAEIGAASGNAGRTSLFQRYAPGTILDAFAGTEYEFPAAAIDASRYVVVLQAELRAIAARLVMPEFMLTSDASNANYASTMVAEGPAVRMFQRVQNEMLHDDVELLRRVVAAAAAGGRLPGDCLSGVDVQGVPPSLAVRDRFKEAQADEILVRNGAMSPQTMAMRHGLDPDRERRLMRRRADSAENAPVAQNQT